MSLQSRSPKSSPPQTPSPPCRESRSASWRIPNRNQSSRDSILSLQLPSYGPQPPSKRHDDISNILSNEDPNTEEFLNWRRLHLSKAKLEGITEITTVMTLFSVKAANDLKFDETAGAALLICLAITTSLLVSTSMLTVMITTCILPHIEVVAELYPKIKIIESPHDRLKFYIDLTWVLASSVSIFLFTLDMVIIIFIKYKDVSEISSWCATSIFVPVLIIVSIFGVAFYRQLMKYQHIVLDKKYQELEAMKRDIDSGVITI